MPKQKLNPGKPNPGQLNSVQLNVVTFVDVQKAIATKTLVGSMYMMDNSVGSVGQGTPNLKTTCKQGQVINWIIYAMDMEKRMDNTWPPMAKFNHIVFLDDDGRDVAELKVTTEFKIYGGPDKVRTKETPVYYYWAGTVLPDLPVGVYKYRFVVELDTKDPEAKYLNISTPSLNVVPLLSDS